MTDKLRECPFCGGEVILDKEDIFCDECHLSMKIYTRLENKEAETYEEAREQTIEAWNTRRPMDRIVEQLEYQAEINRLNGMEKRAGKKQTTGYCLGINKAIAIVKGVQNE